MNGYHEASFYIIESTVKLYRQIKGKEARIGVIRLYHLGLALVFEFGKVRITAAGLDIDLERTKFLSPGKAISIIFLLKI